MQLAMTMSTGITSIGLWPHNPNPQPEGVWTDLGGSRLSARSVLLSTSAQRSPPETRPPKYPLTKLKPKNGDDIFE